MLKDKVPQDNGFLNTSREVCYAVDENGNYVQVLSKGWETKTEALKQVWDEVNEKVEAVRKEVLNETKSPIAYYMEKNLMDLSVLSGYVNLSKWRIRRHLKPRIFKKLRPELLKRYADAFNITPGQLVKLPENQKTQ